MDDPVPAWLATWKGDGIIARVESRAMERAILNTGLPAVDLRGKYDLAFPQIETNDRLVSELAAEHLVQRGFRHFAYCGIEGVNYSQQRLEHFPPYLGRLGFECHVYPPPDQKLQGDQRMHEQHGILFEQELARWVESLPKPVGIMACNDLRGQQLLNACREIDVAVPEEVAVVGVDNDQLICELSDPPLSSVEPNTHRIGYEAAAMLDRMMLGKKPAERKTFVEPRSVVTRQSTDVLAVSDRDVARALRFIRERACDGINVEDVLRHVAVSRVTLNRRFEKLLHRSPKAEITRIQMQRVKHLLGETDFSLAKIASLTGFKHSEYLSVVFKEKAGQIASEFRRRARRGKV